MLLLSSAFATGCTKKKQPAASPGQQEQSIDLAADKAAFASGWLADIARDPAPLVEVAQSSDGWRLFFTGESRNALSAFLEDRKSSPLAIIGAARTALDLARAEHELGRLIVALTPQLFKAQKTRPDAASSADWRAYLEARLAIRQGQEPTEALARIKAESPAAPWAAAIAPGAEGPLAALLAAKAEGIDAELPPGATEAYGERLTIAALVTAGRLKEARKRIERIDPAEPDLRIGEGEKAVAMRDPALADLGARVHAALVVELLSDAQGWPLLLKADALRMLGRLDEADSVLQALLAQPPADAPMALILLSDTLDAAELAQSGAALRARVLAAKGDNAGAAALVDGLPRETVGQRVRRAWAGSFIKRVDADAFPQDRTAVSRVYTDALTQLGEQAKGLNDVADLALVDRYVDALQRRFADALILMDRPALAVKMREAAEDKTSAQAPSPRNTLPALTAAAYDSVRISRPRVALKYLSRMKEALPASSAPAEMLRDLLSYRAMEHGGGVTSGQ